jgi:hypothetical protein
VVISCCGDRVGNQLFLAELLCCSDGRVDNQLMNLAEVTFSCCDGRGGNQLSCCQRRQSSDGSGSNQLL